MKSIVADKKRHIVPLVIAGGVMLCALLGAVWPGVYVPKPAPPTSWRRTVNGWQRIDQRILDGEQIVRPPAEHARFHPLALATFQIVSSTVGLFGARRLRE